MSTKAHLNKRELMDFLGLTAWTFRAVAKEIPAVVLPGGSKRWDINDVVYWRDQHKQGGWIESHKEAIR